MFQIVAIFTVKKEAVESFKPLIAPLVEGSRHDAGNLSYEFKQDALNPAVFIVLEKWENDAALEAHMNQPHFKKFAAESESMLASPMAIHKLML